MKNINWLLLCTVIVLLFTSCAKDGEKGDTGPAGANGNANIIMYQFDSITFTSSTNLTLQNLSRTIVDKSLILTYFNPSTEAATAWYQCPGLGSSGAYNTRFFIYQDIDTLDYILGLRALLPDGSGPYTNSLTWNKFKVIIAPANTIIEGRNAGIKFESYEATKEYLKLKD